MRTSPILIAILSVLAIGLFASFIWANSKSEENGQLKANNAHLSSQLAQLDSLKMDLQHEVDSLIATYTALAQENEELQSKLVQKDGLIARKTALVKNVRSASASDIRGLKQQMQDLINLKVNMEVSIHEIYRQNDSLKVEIVKKEEEVEVVKKEKKILTQLKENLENDLTLSNFKATAFRVEVEGKKGKVTSKGKRARNIVVSFDLNEIPAKYQGTRPLYMIIKDEQQNVIATDQFYPVTISRGDQTLNIHAVMRQQAEIGADQRINFNYDLEDKLQEGYYRIEIYTDIALLGVTSFRVG